MMSAETLEQKTINSAEQENAHATKVTGPLLEKFGEAYQKVLKNVLMPGGLLFRKYDYQYDSSGRIIIKSIQMSGIDTARAFFRFQVTPLLRSLY